MEKELKKRYNSSCVLDIDLSKRFMYIYSFNAHNHFMRKYCYFVHFKDERPQAQRGYIMYPRSHS